jgi:amino acid transporter
LLGAGAALSAFAATLASATGAARVAIGFAESGPLPRVLARVHARSGTPEIAFLTTLALGAIGCGAFAFARASGTDAFAACGTIATLALVAIYAAVQVAALRLFGSRWHLVQRAIPVVALASLGATFVANVVPIPPWPAAVYPYVVLAWMLLGAALLRGKRATLHDTERALSA